MTKPESLASMISYQPGVVVSRTLVKKPAGTVTLFAFERDQGLSEHTTSFDALVQVVEGESTITIGGAPHEVVVGQVLLLPANIPHAVQAKTPFKMLLTMIRA